LKDEDELITLLNLNCQSIRKRIRVGEAYGNAQEKLFLSFSSFLF